MTAQPASYAVARREKEDKLVGWLRRQQDDLAMAAASHLKPSTVIRVAQGALRRDDKLMAAAIANPQSLLYCMLDAARLGHEPGTDQYWLIPFGDEVTGIEGYKGIVERMYRAGAVSSVHVQVVRDRDAYRSMGDRMPPVHEYDDFADAADRGPLRGVYAYAIMTGGGCSQVIRMGRAEIMRHKAMSRGSGRTDSPWKLWEEAMWKKTPLRALEPYVPTSSEWLITRARAAAVTTSPQVITTGWERSPAAAEAPGPLHLIASEVTEPDTTDPSSPAPPLSPPSAATTPANPAPAESAGEEGHDPAPAAQGDGHAAGAEPKPPMASRGQAAAIEARFLNLGYADTPDDKATWLRITGRLAGYDGELRGIARLTAEQAASVLRQLQGITGQAELQDLLSDGVKTQEEPPPGTEWAEAEATRE